MAYVYRTVENGVVAYVYRTVENGVVAYVYRTVENAATHTHTHEFAQSNYHR